MCASIKSEKIIGLSQYRNWSTQEHEEEQQCESNRDDHTENRIRDRSCSMTYVSQAMDLPAKAQSNPVAAATVIYNQRFIDGLPIRTATTLRSLGFIANHQRIHQHKRRIKTDKEAPVAGRTVAENETHCGPEPAPRNNQHGLPKRTPPQQEWRADHRALQPICPGRVNRRIERRPPIEVSLRRDLSVR